MFIMIIFTHRLQTQVADLLTRIKQKDYGNGIEKMHKIEKMTPFWDDEYKFLDYQREAFNDPELLNQWKKDGYTHKYYVGKMADFRKEQPSWNNLVKEHFRHWNDVGTSYYVMETGVILPEHADLYARYKQAYELWHNENINRAVIFLEDRKPGHIFEIDGECLNWKAGDYVVWQNDNKHSAANIGIEPRYTLQVTGWTKAT